MSRNQDMYQAWWRKPLVSAGRAMQIWVPGPAWSTQGSLRSHMNFRLAFFVCARMPLWFVVLLWVQIISGTVWVLKVWNVHMGMNAYAVISICSGAQYFVFKFWTSMIKFSASSLVSITFHHFTRYNAQGFLISTIQLIFLVGVNLLYYKDPNLCICI